MNEQQVRAIVQQMLKQGQYSVPKVPYHIHNGVDSAKLAFSSVSINGLATGTSVTAVASDTEVILQPSQVFANGITYSSSTGAFTITTAGQYLITGLIGWTSSQTGYLYQALILTTPKGGSSTEISTSYNIGNSGALISSQASIIYNLGVGDIIQLAAYCSYTSGGTVSNTTNLTYLAIAKV